MLLKGHNKIQHRPRPAEAGFSLVEVLVATMISAFVAMVAVGTLKAVSSSSACVETISERASELRFVSDLLHHDLVNVYRDRDFRSTRFLGSVEQSAGVDQSSLTFYTVSRAKARAAQPEGEVYEVEYYVSVTDDQTLLMRRYWPNPDPNSQAGGVLTTLSEQIAAFSVRFFDGTQWSSQWTEEMQTLPQLVEVKLATAADGKRSPLADTFVVNLSRATGQDMAAVETAPDEGADTQGQDQTSSGDTGQTSSDPESSGETRR